MLIALACREKNPARLDLIAFTSQTTQMQTFALPPNISPRRGLPDHNNKKGKGSPYSITERRVPELIPVLGSQPAGEVSHKPGGRLPLLCARPAVTPATLTRVATNIIFAAW